MSLQFLNVESCGGRQCHGVREASRTVTVRYTNTYCMSCFLQSLGCKKRRVDGSLDNSNLEPLEILWLFFPLLILNVQQHVVQRLEPEKGKWHDMKHGHLNSEISRNGILQVVFGNLFHKRLCCDLIHGT